MSEAIDFVNYILSEKGEVSIPQKGFDITKSKSFDAYDKVYAVLAHWDYKHNCVKEYEGIRWIFHQWGKLREKYNHEDFVNKVSGWKICVLSFEPIKYIQSKEKIKMLLDLDNVEYLRIPHGQLKDVKEVVEKLSGADIENYEEQLKKLGEFVDERNSLELLDECLHKINKEDDKENDDALERLKKNIDRLHKTLQDEDVLTALREFQGTFENPGSPAFKQAADNLYQKVVRVLYAL